MMMLNFNNDMTLLKQDHKSNNATVNGCMCNMVSLGHRS